MSAGLAQAVERAVGAAEMLRPDEWPRVEGEPVPTAAPASVEALGECLRAARAASARVLAAGAGTWLDAGGGGWPPGGVDLVISTRRLSRVVSFEPDDLVATVEAGLPLASLADALDAGGEWWPVDPLGGGTVGATIATGSSGPLAAGYGWVRDNVLGLTVVLADGRVVRPGGLGGRVVKNVAGYDLTRLLTGSWGTLGVVVEAHLRLGPRPRADSTAAVFADAPGTLLALARRLNQAALRPAASELLSPQAAGPLGVEANRWQMWVRWHGPETAVAGALEGARRLAAGIGAPVEVGPAGGRAWARLAEIETRTDARLTLRWQGLPTALLDGLRLTRAFLGGQTPATLAAPSLGRLWLFVPAATWAAAPARVWADRIARFQKEAERRGAWLVAERAPAEVLATVDPWGDPGAAVRVLRGLKAAFDPENRLAPGRFRWAGASG